MNRIAPAIPSAVSSVVSSVLVALLSSGPACSGAAPPPVASPDAPSKGTTGPEAGKLREKNSTVAGPDTWLSPLSRDHQLVGQIWDVSAGRSITREQLAARVSAAPFVLLGESHENPDHHRLQAAVIDMIARAGRSPAIVFEMIDPKKQATLDRQLATAPGDVDGVGAAIEWDASGWPAWTLYRPVFASALAAHAHLFGAALPRAQAMELARGKRELPAELSARYSLDQPLPGGLHDDLSRQLHDSHCGHMPEAMLAPMVGIQRARDALMADGLRTHATPGGAVLIAGGGHVRSDRGVPWYLRKIGRPAGDIVTIGFIEVTDDAPTVADYARRLGGSLPFDYVWFTPRANDIDRCKQLEEQMKHREEKQTQDQSPAN